MGNGVGHIFTLLPVLFIQYLGPELLFLQASSCCFNLFAVNLFSGGLKRVGESLLLTKGGALKEIYEMLGKGAEGKCPHKSLDVVISLLFLDVGINWLVAAPTWLKRTHLHSDLMPFCRIMNCW